MDKLFDQSTEASLATNADNTEISHPTDITQGIASVFALYWVYNIAYSWRLMKTLSFIDCRVCKLEKSKATVAMQRQLIILYSL
jgi:hypothetical protein